MGWLSLGLTLWLCHSCAQSSWIMSPNLTTWGDWGPVDKCPTNTFVNGIQVKAEPDQGSGDDTSLNGVKLSCTDVKYPDNTSRIPYTIKGTINSSVMQFGDWRPWSYCVQGIAIGFELRSEENQGGGDDSAANDMKLTCANHSGLHTTEEHGGKFGNWTGVQRCPKYTAVCGIQTQVESKQGSGDDSALNNVGLLCCDLRNPAKLCKPSDEWVQIWSSNVPAAESPACVSIQVKHGVIHTNTSSESDNVIDQVSSAVGFGTVVDVLSWLAQKFETSLSNSVTTAKYHWFTTMSSSWKTEKEESMGFIIKPRCNSTLLQVVGKCGSYTVRVKKLKRVDDCANGTVESDVGWKSTVCPGKGRALAGVGNILVLGFCLATYFL